MRTTPSASASAPGAASSQNRLRQNVCLLLKARHSVVHSVGVNVFTPSEVNTISSPGSASQSLGRRNFTFLRARICKICVHATCDAVARPRATAMHSHVCVPRIHACIARGSVCTRAFLHVCTHLSYFVRSKDKMVLPTLQRGQAGSCWNHSGSCREPASFCLKLTLPLSSITV